MDDKVPQFPVKIQVYKGKMELRVSDSLFSFGFPCLTVL